MAKPTRDESDQAYSSSSKKISKTTSVCGYCDKIFTVRGMSLHQRKCSIKQAHDNAQAKKTHAYNFTILNEAIHEEILSFLNNQTLTKMQMITGDRYDQCEPELARYCCKCENDNPAVPDRCLQCETLHPVYRGSAHYERLHVISKDVAKTNYGVEEKDFPCIRSIDSSRFLNNFARYTPAVLENYMIRKCGSKLKWLRHIAKMNNTRKKRRASLQLRQETKSFLETLAPGFADYVRVALFKETNKRVLVQCSERYVALKARLEECELELVWGSNPFREFVTAGDGNIEDLVAYGASLQIS